MRSSVRGFLLSAFLTLGLCAQDGTQTLFQEYGMGARSHGFGKAYVALATDGSAVFWNPSGLDYVPQSNFVFFHSTLFESYFNFASVTYPTVNFGSFGFGIARFSVSDIQFWDDVEEAGIKSAFYRGYGSTDQEEVYVAYGKRLPWFGLSLGTTFKIVRVGLSAPIQADIPSGSGYGSGLDVGFMWRPDVDNAILRNLSVGMNFQNLIAPSVKVVDREDNQKYNLRFGVAKDLFFGEESLRKLTVSTDIVKGQAASKVGIYAGAEFSFNRYLKTRAGYDNGQMAAGFGTEFKQFETVAVDYSIGFGSKIGTSFHRLSLTINFGKSIDEQNQIARAVRVEEDQKLLVKNQEEVRLRALKEHQAMGKQLFKEGKLIPALVEFEQVATLDPDNETAKLYMDSINYLMDKQLAAQLADTAASVKNITIMEENDKFIRDHYKKGYQYIQQGDYLAAISEFQAAYDRAPNNNEVASALREARSLLDKRIANFIAKARSSAAANNFAEALKMLSEARALDPGNQNIQKEIDSELRRINNRLNFLESTRNGLDAYQRGDYPAAMELFEKALLIDPTNETVKEYHKKAIVRSFATFKALEGDNEKTYLQGVDLYVEGKYEQAIIIWKRILEKDPLNRRVLNAVDKAEQQLEQIRRNQKKSND